jgi:hypothetical protein
MSRKRDNTFRRAAILGAACIVGPACIGLASCSLGLDEGLIATPSEASSVDVQLADTFVPEGGDGALPPIQPEAGVCTKDDDCKGTAGCLTAKCDIPRKACVLDVCRQPACNSGVCDTAMQKCGAPRPYKYRATQFPVGAQIGCGGALARCFAAVYPFVFVGTANGVVAFAANDPLNAAPASVPITGLGFVPTQIIASGSRVYFLGTPVGAGTSSRVPVAYADVPPDPFAAKIGVTTVLAGFNRPASDPVVLATRGNDTALLLDVNVAAAYASAPVEPPLTEPVNFGSTGIAFTAGALPVAMSGSRLVMGQINPAAAAIFGFVNAAGSATPMTVADVPIPTAAPASGPQYFAQSADGAVFWSYVSLTSAPPFPPGGPTIRAAKAYFLVADGAATFDPTGGIDLEVYPAFPVGTPTVGPVAMLDSKTAMVTTSAPGNPGALTNVGFVTRGATVSIVKNADNTPRRFPITLSVNQLAAAGSHGLGYILAVDPAAPAAPTVHVFDPACAP